MSRAMRLSVEIDGQERLVTVEPGTEGSSLVTVKWSDRAYEVDVSRLHAGRFSFIIPAFGYVSHEVSCYETESGEVALGIGGRQIKARVADSSRPKRATVFQAGGDRAVTAPMPGRLVRVLVEEDEKVVEGQGLAVVEAMKMENEVSSPADGVVKEVCVVAGESVEAGGVLVVVAAGSLDD